MSFIKKFPHAHLLHFQLSGVRDDASLSIEECLHLIDANFPSEGDPEVETWSRMQRFIFLQQFVQHEFF